MYKKNKIENIELGNSESLNKLLVKNEEISAIINNIKIFIDNTKKTNFKQMDDKYDQINNKMKSFMDTQKPLIFKKEVYKIENSQNNNINNDNNNTNINNCNIKDNISNNIICNTIDNSNNNINSNNNFGNTSDNTNNNINDNIKNNISNNIICNTTDNTNNYINDNINDNNICISTDNFNYNINNNTDNIIDNNAYYEYDIPNSSIIIDNGSGYIKVGFSGDEAPKFVFPSYVGYPKYAYAMPSCGIAAYVGSDAEAKRGVLRLNYPIKHGVVTNWDDMEKIWEYIFNKN